MLKLLFSFDGVINRSEFAIGYALLQVITFVYSCLLYMLYSNIVLLDIFAEWLTSTTAIWEPEDRFLPSNTNVYIMKFLLPVFGVCMPIAYIQIAMMYKRLRHLDYVPVNMLLFCHMPIIVILILIAADVELGKFGIFYLIPFFIPNALFGLLILSAVIGQFWLYFVCFAKRGNG